MIFQKSEMWFTVSIAWKNLLIPDLTVLHYKMFLLLKNQKICFHENIVELKNCFQIFMILRRHFWETLTPSPFTKFASIVLLIWCTKLWIIFKTSAQQQDIGYAWMVCGIFTDGRQLGPVKLKCCGVFFSKQPSLLGS